MNTTESDDQLRHATGTSGQNPDTGLARQLAELARTMQAEPDLPGVLQRITAATVSEVDGADYAGISLIVGNRVETQAATHRLVHRIDEEQYRLQQGPCLDALRDELTVRADDFHDEPRWPELASAALGLGVRSMLAVQLFVAGDNLGALNIFSTEPRAFTNRDESTAMLLAAHAAIAMQSSSVESHLRIAVESRDIIGQGKGILMERYKINSLEAFDLLVVASQHTNRKLRDVADALATTGEMTAD